MQNEQIQTMKTVKLIPTKHEDHTHGQRKHHVKRTAWTCDLKLTREDGSTKTIPSINFMNAQTLKRTAIEKANEYKAYILSKGNFYFV